MPEQDVKQALQMFDAVIDESYPRLCAGYDLDAFKNGTSPLTMLHRARTLSS